MPDIPDILIRSAEDITLFDTPILLNRNNGLTLEQRFVKRAMDIVFAAVMLVLSLPFMLITALCVKLQDGGPAILKQERMTQNGRRFYVYKFRSMIVDAEKATGAKLADKHDIRITPVGSFIRKVRLDELPQLWNIFIGDMSIVGPRPERPELADEHLKTIPEFAYRLKVRAGLTGYAQVVGKYNTSAYDKLKMDLMYISKYSLLLDLKIIFITFKILFKKESTEGMSE
jgi:lipopolysaccharide/colanic/teichoic acid biosynthesis glycosyltransferase